MANGDFQERRRTGSGGWWSWRPAQHALHYLWMTGALAIHSRRHFQKRYDLLERALPAARDVEPVSAEVFQRWHVEASLHAMGAATERDLAGYLTYPRFPRGTRRAALAGLRAAGEVTEIEVAEAPGTWLALTRDLPALARAGRRAAAGGAGAARGTTLLSPFDSLLWYRDRVARLFDFSYRIEVYTPGPQRVHGYYTLPILHDGHLIGRVDAKADRAAGQLLVRKVTVEPWLAAGHRPPRDGAGPLDVEGALAGLADALASLAVFVGAGKIRLGPVVPGRLRAPLARALRLTAARAPATMPAT
jgi:uncharacterized protein YcaQ